MPHAHLRRCGEALGQERCSACHIVAEKQEYPPLLRNPAPSFQSIANRPEDLRKLIGTCRSHDSLGSEDGSHHDAKPGTFQN